MCVFVLFLWRRDWTHLVDGRRSVSVRTTCFYFASSFRFAVGLLSRRRVHWTLGFWVDTTKNKVNTAEGILEKRRMCVPEDVTSFTQDRPIDRWFFEGIRYTRYLQGMWLYIRTLRALNAPIKLHPTLSALTMSLRSNLVRSVASLLLCLCGRVVSVDFRCTKMLSTGCA